MAWRAAVCSHAKLPRGFFSSGADHSDLWAVMASNAVHGEKTRRVIGITGKAGHGKDTVGGILCNDHGFWSMHYSEPIKRACAELFDVPLERFYDPEAKEVADPGWNDWSPRKMMQWLGTDAVRRDVDADFFVKHMRRRIAARPGQDIVVTDVRFDNEARMLRDAFGAEIWLVDASKRLADNSGPLKGDTVLHATEKGISSDLVDRVVDNNGSFPDLGFIA